MQLAIIDDGGKRHETQEARYVMAIYQRAASCARRFSRRDDQSQPKISEQGGRNGGVSIAGEASLLSS